MKCPLCDGDSIFYHDFQQNPYRFKVRRCVECDILFQEEINEPHQHLYQEEYYKNSKTDKKNSEIYRYHDERNVSQAASSVWKARVKNIRKYVQEGNFLDVGCAFGGLLNEASRYFQTVGIDISEYAVKEGKEWCRDKDIYGIFQASLVELPKDKIFTEGNFQVITMVEVAEHLSQPRESLEAAYRLLSPGGLLLIQTANFEGWQAKKAGVNYHYFLPGHLIYYTAASLRKTLQEIGFKNFREFVPVDFSVFPKLVKSRASFAKISDYVKWLRIIGYHFKSKFRYKGSPLTSSYVLYAFK